MSTCFLNRGSPQTQSCHLRACLKGNMKSTQQEKRLKKIAQKFSSTAPLPSYLATTTHTTDCCWRIRALTARQEAVLSNHCKLHTQTEFVFSLSTQFQLVRIVTGTKSWVSDHGYTVLWGWDVFISAYKEEGTIIMFAISSSHLVCSITTSHIDYTAQ